MKPQQYATQIIWSQEDGAYLACPLELPGCVADGQTPIEALQNLAVIIDEWIEVAQEEGRRIPPPMTREDQERFAHKFQQQLQQHIQNEVNSAVQRVLNQIGEQQRRMLRPGIFADEETGELVFAGRH